MSVSLVGAKVLIVITSHAQLGNTGKPTGYYLPEVSHPYAELAEKGFTVDIASPQGGEAPLDPKSLKLDDPINKEFWENPVTRAKLVNTIKLSNVVADDYQAILYAGGHGTMWDFPNQVDAQLISRKIYENGGIVAAVCHGPAALVNITLSNGRYLVDGKDLTGFSNAEEEAAGLTNVMPFLLEDALKSRGARYTKAGLWQEKVVVSERLVTGQNPASAGAVGRKVAELLQ